MSKSLLFGLALAAVSVANAAQAALIDVVYIGTVDPGVIDSGGSFGMVGADLTLDPIRVEYRFNTIPTVTTGSGTSTHAGSDGTNPSSALTATITIAGSSVSFDGLAYGLVTATSNGTSSSVGHEADSVDGTSFVSSSVGAGPSVFPLSVSDGYAYTLQTDDIYTGQFALLSGPSGTFTPTSVSSQEVGIVSTVPLPPALPLFAVGLIGLGSWRGFRSRGSSRSKRI